MSTPGYSLSFDFGGNINEEQFHKEILAESGITKTLYGVEKTGDNITVLFNVSLSAGEKTILDSIVSSHIPSNIPIFTNKQTLNPRVESTSCFDYFKVYSALFPGGTYANLKINSYMDEGCTSYDIRIVDRNNRNEMGSGNFTNTIEQENDIGLLTFVPSTEVTIEIHIRTNGGSSLNYAHSLSALLEYI